jgi:hypothetical protein
MNSAFAESTPSGSNLAVVLGGLLLDTWTEVAGIPVSAILTGFNYGLGKSVNTWSPYIFGIRKILLGHELECQEGKYVYTKDFVNKVKMTAEYLGAEKQCATYKKEQNFFAGALCETLQRSQIYLDRAIGKDANRFYVTDQKLKEIFAPKSVPECDSRSAARVQGVFYKEMVTDVFKPLISAVEKMTPAEKKQINQSTSSKSKVGK